MDVSKIVGAFNYSFISFSKRDHIIIVWDESGNLYMPITDTVYRITDISIYEFVFKFEFNYHCSRYGSLRNEIFTRIEDIYGMSIDEFSLGQLDYE